MPSVRCGQTEIVRGPDGDGDEVASRAPGRVNLIGDHTDYTGGLVLPMAIDRWTEVVGRRGGPVIELVSAADPVPARVVLPVREPALVEPVWARYVGAVAAELGTTVGLSGRVASTVPIGHGLSSSAALELATALALAPIGTRVDPLALALLGQRAEHRATGVPTGIMDQLTSAAGQAGHALLIDCGALTWEPIAMPADVDVVVIPSGQARTVAGSAYAERAAQCAAAEVEIGPLRLATTADLTAVADPVVRARAHHVVTENARVRAAAVALGAGDAVDAGRLMLASHASLRDDFAVSTPLLDALVAALAARRGVFGARLTGAAFGGSVVALTEPGALADVAGAEVVRAVDGACR